MAKRTPIPLIWDIHALADWLNVRPETISRYRWNDPNFPEPDITLGGHPGWLPETIHAWENARPGRTGRPAKAAGR